MIISSSTSNRSRPKLEAEQSHLPAENCSTKYQVNSLDGSTTSETSFGTMGDSSGQIRTGHIVGQIHKCAVLNVHLQIGA